MDGKEKIRDGLERGERKGALRHIRIPIFLFRTTEEIGGVRRDAGSYTAIRLYAAETIDTVPVGGNGRGVVRPVS
jgi:hypothetical protein